MSTVAPGGQVVDRAPEEPAGATAPASQRPARLARLRSLAGALLGYGVAQLVLLVVLYRTYDRFFYLDDKQAQYVPMFRWLGQQVAADGRPPLIDPDQGMAGAFVADLQYGVLDPVHWALTRWISTFDGLNGAAWSLSILAMLVLGTGSVVLAHSLGARPWLAAAAGLGASSSGFLLWFGATWWPAAWASAFLPWMFWALRGRSWSTTLLLAPIAYLLGTAGYPYAFFAAGVIVVGVVAEHVAASRRGEPSLRLVAGKLVAGAAGLAGAAPGLLLANSLSPYSGRAAAPDVAFGNLGQLIPNALDVVVGGPTLLGSTPGYWGLIVPAPIFAVAWFAVPGVALVDWRRAWRVAGVPTLAALVVVGVLMTQLPTYVGGFRYSFRYLAIAQPAAAVLLAVALSRAAALTRRRVVVAGVLVLSQVALAVARTPALTRWHVVGGLVLAVGVAALVVGLRSGRGVLGLAAGAVLLVVAVVTPWVGVRTSIGADAEFNASVGEPPTGLPATPVYRGEDWPADVQGFRDASWQPGLHATVISWGPRGAVRGLEAGILDGSANLISDVEGGYGYTSVGQAAWQDIWCADFVGAVNASCGDALPKLLSTAPGTDSTWVDLLSQDRVLISNTSPEELRSHFDRTWRLVEDRRGYTLYEREQPLQGRVTWQQGVSDLSAESVSDESQSYRVSTGADGGSLAFYDTWWPGYTAELDGRALDVESVGGVDVRVVLPAGVDDGELVVRYDPPQARLLPLAWVAAVVLAGLGVLVGHGGGLIGRARAGRRSTASSPA